MGQCGVRQQLLPLLRWGTCYCSVSPAACSDRYGGHGSFAITFSLGLMCNYEAVILIVQINSWRSFPVKEEGCLRPSTSLLAPAGKGMAIQPRYVCSVATHWTPKHLSVVFVWGWSRCVWISTHAGFPSDEFLDTQLLSLSTSLVPLSCTALWSASVLERKTLRALWGCCWLYLLCRSWFHYAHIFYHLLSLPVVRIITTKFLLWML